MLKEDPLLTMVCVSTIAKQSTENTFFDFLSLEHDHYIGIYIAEG